MNRKGAKNAKRLASENRVWIEHVGSVVIDSAIRVHRELGPGLLESAYQTCLAYEIGLSGLEVVCEQRLPVKYRGVVVDLGYRMDMVIERAVVVENKTVEQLLPVHEAQLLTYLRISRLRLGYILNWHVDVMKHGIKRMVLGL